MAISKRGEQRKSKRLTVPVAADDPAQFHSADQYRQTLIRISNVSRWLLWKSKNLPFRACLRPLFKQAEDENFQLFCCYFRFVDAPPRLNGCFGDRSERIRSQCVLELRSLHYRVESKRNQKQHKNPRVEQSRERWMSVGLQAANETQMSKWLLVYSLPEFD